MKSAGMFNLSGPKLWWFHFLAKPLPDAPDYADFSGGFIDVWVAQSNGAAAEAIARDSIALTRWGIVRLMAKKHDSLKMCNGLPHIIEHFQRAMSGGQSMAFYRVRTTRESEAGNGDTTDDLKTNDSQANESSSNDSNSNNSSSNNNQTPEDKTPEPVVTPEMVPAPGTGIQVATQESTDENTGITCTEEFFTRDGRPRLRRTTYMRGAELVNRTQAFFHGGKNVAVLAQSMEPRSESFTSFASSCQLAVDFSPSKEIERLLMFENGGSLVDGFIAANGIFQLMSDSDLSAGKGNKGAA